MINISLNTQTLLVGVGMGLLVFFVIKRMRYRLPPGPWCIPLVGHYNVYSSVEMHRKIVDYSKIYGPVVRLSFGPITMVFLNDVEVVQEAMIQKKADFAGRPKLASGETLSEGGKDIIFSTYSATWKFHRRIAGKAIRHYLQGDLLENMIHNSMVKFLDKMTQEKDPFIIRYYLDRMVFHQIYTICFGEKRPIDDPEVEALLELDDGILEDFGVGVFEDIFPYLKDIYPTARWTSMTRKMKEILDIIRANFKQHVDTFEPGVNRDFIDSLLTARQEAENEGDKAALEQLDDTHLIQTVVDIFFAGVETTRFTMDWFVYFMTKHPEIQSKCREEIDRVVGMERPSLGDRDSLHFTEACMFETLRLGNVAGLGPPHLTICDSQVGGYDIPKGTIVFINFWALHHDPKYWKEPEKFDPYRYLDEDGKMKPTRPDSWLPFSAGRRVCLGEAVAKPEILLMCANLLQRFEIHLPDGVKPNPEPKMTGFGVEVPFEYKVVVKNRA